MYYIIIIIQYIILYIIYHISQIIDHILYIIYITLLKSQTVHVVGIRIWNQHKKYFLCSLILFIFTRATAHLWF